MRYNAFISYRHADLDTEIAKKVHRGLETFKVPRAVKKATGVKKINRVFRDQEELPIGSDLTDNIDKALAESEYLIVICSPRTPGSEWVAKEIDTFIRLRDRNHVLAILIEGEPDESFPPALLVDEQGNKVEPLAADVRGATRGERNKKFAVEIMRLAAPLVGCSFDDLRQRHRERMLRRTVALASCLAAVGIAFGAYNAYQNALIQQNYREKQQNQARYLASESLNVLAEGDRRNAALIAHAAWKMGQENQLHVPSAEYALVEALHVYDDGYYSSDYEVLSATSQVKTIHGASDGTFLAALDVDGNSYLWDVAKGELLLKIPCPVDESGAENKPNNIFYYKEHLITISNGSVQSYDLKGNCTVTAECGGADGVLSETRGVLAVNDAGIAIHFLDAVTLEEVQTYSYPNAENSIYGDPCRYAAMQFSDSGKYLALGQCYLTAGGYVMEQNAIAVDVYDLDEQDIISHCQIDGCNEIDDLCFAGNERIAVIATQYVDMAESMNDGVDSFLVAGFSLDGKEEWQHAFTANRNMFYAAKGKVLSHSYTEGDRSFDETIATFHNQVVCIDNVTGELLGSDSASSGIQAMEVNESRCYAFVADSNGTIHTYNTQNCVAQANFGIETDQAITHMVLAADYLLYSTSDSKIYVKGYQQSAFYEEVEKTENTIGAGIVSEDGCYQVFVAFTDQYRDYRIYKEGKYQEQYHPPLEKGYAECIGFDAWSRLWLLGTDGTLIIYDVTSGRETIIKAPTDSGNVYPGRFIKENSQYYLGIANWVYVYDVASMKLVDSYEMMLDEEALQMEYMMVDENGEFVYANLRDGRVIAYQLSDGTCQVVEQIAMHRYSDKMIMSESGNMLLVRTRDGELALVDTASLQVVDHIALDNYYFAAFIEADTKLLIQSKDGHLRIYDIEGKAYSYISDGSYSMIDGVEIGEKGCYLKSSTELVLLDASTMEPVARVPYGKLYDGTSGYVYMARYRNLGRFHVLSAEEIEAEMNRQYPDTVFSVEEQLKYHMN